MIMIPRRESFSGSLPRQLGSFSYTHPISYSSKHTGVQGSKVKRIVLLHHSIKSGRCRVLI
jgi:hypothetical protein